MPELNDKDIEKLAKFAAETLNGGDFYQKNYYNCKHKEAWENMVTQLIQKIKEYECQH